MAKTLALTNEQKPLLEPIVIGTGENSLKVSLYETFQDDIDAYARYLKVARGIPQSESANLDIKHPVVQFYIANENIPENELGTKAAEEKLNKVYKLAMNWFSNASIGAEKDANILALMTDNEFNFEPKPYPKRRQLPGLPVEPDLPIDLNDSIERRLKQCYDALNSVEGGMEAISKTLFSWTVMQDKKNQKS